MHRYFNLQEKQIKEAVNEILTFHQHITFKEKKETRDFLKNHSYILTSLTAREMQVIDLFFGLSNNRYANLQSIASELSFTHKQVNLTLQNAFKKLRSSPRFEALIYFKNSDIELNDLTCLTVEKLTELVEQKEQEIYQQRYIHLSFEDQQAEDCLNKILSTKFIRLNFEDNASFAQHFYTIKDVVRVLRFCKESSYKNLISKLKSIGIYLASDFLYEEDWRKFCREQIKKIGVDEISKILGWEIETKNQSFYALSHTKIKDLNFSDEIYERFEILGYKIIEDIITAKTEDLEKLKLSKAEFNQVLRKLKMLKIDICPDNMSPLDWLTAVSFTFNENVEQLFNQLNQEDEAQKFETLLATEVEELNLSKISTYFLQRTNLKTVEDIIKQTEDFYKPIYDIFGKILTELKEVLSSLNLELRPSDEYGEDIWIRVLKNERLGVSNNKYYRCSTEPLLYKENYISNLPRLIAKMISDYKEQNTLIINSQKHKYRRIKNKQILLLIEDDLSLIPLLSKSFVTNNQQKIKNIIKNSTASQQEKEEYLAIVETNNESVTIN